MYTFDMILNIVLTAILGYVTLNTIFRFHFSLDRIGMAAVLALIATIIWYRGTEKYFEFGLTLGIEIVAFAVLKLITYRRRNFGYFLFNVYRKDFEIVHKELVDLSTEMEIERKHICHYRNRPFLLVIKDEDPKRVSSLVKKIDTIHTKGKKTFTMYNYWFIVAFIVLEVIIWRF